MNDEKQQPLSELMNHRLDKIGGLKAKNIDPYPTGTWKPDSTAQSLREKFGDIEKETEISDNYFKLAGRITLRRAMGKATFIDITDSTGKLQVYLRQDKIGENKYRLLVDFVDIGDIVGVEGHIFKTRMGELTLFAKDFVMLSKSLRPLPEKWHGLTDTEARYRQRYLDLISNTDIKEVFVKRNQIIETIRETLKNRSFIEVETPMLHPIPGGALAKPFLTHHNALDTDLYLRIAPELYLKRLLVGGFEKVFEIGKSFRNEGIDRRHNPEFTMVEAYQAYANYEDMMALCEDVVKTAALKINPKMNFSFEDKSFDLNINFKRESYLELIKKYTEEDFEGFFKESGKGISTRVYEKLGIATTPQMSIRKIFDDIFDKYVLPNLVEPTFVLDFPKHFSPLAQASKEKPFLAERFELYIACEEISNAYSELNDPIEQEQRFSEQQQLKSSLKDDEALFFDSDYISALEHGMPPAGGLGIGIDRLTMLLTGMPSIREVVLFPTLRSLRSEKG